MTEGKPFQAGDEVFLIRQARWGNAGLTAAQLTKVAKVYKTGNFVLEGSSQQYRPSGHEAGQRLGSTWFTVVHATDEMRANVTEAKELNILQMRALNALESATKRVRKADTTAEIREIMATLWDDQSD